MNLTLNQVKKIVGGTYHGDAVLLKKRIKRISINTDSGLVQPFYIIDERNSEI